MRSGSQALSILATPLNVHALEALDEEPIALPDLRRSIGYPPVTTMRSYLRNLTELGLIERRRESDFPGSVSYAIARPGEKLLAVAEVLQQWLATAPDGPIGLGSRASKNTLRALIDAWDACIVRALAARPLALTELDRLIPSVSYPALERRLTSMRQVGLVEPDPERDGRVARYRATQWLRHAAAPLAAGVGWERRWISDHAPAPGRLDAEAAFLLAIPLLDLAPEIDGTCRLAVDFRQGSDHEFAGVTVSVKTGRIRSCVTRSEGQPDAWATGPVVDWLRWLGEADGHRLEVGGDPSLANGVRDGLRSAYVPLLRR